jgi:hypothetical protein
MKKKQRLKKLHKNKVKLKKYGVNNNPNLQQSILHPANSGANSADD